MVFFVLPPQASPQAPLPKERVVVYKPPQAPPKEGMSLTLFTCFHSFQTISNISFCFTISPKPMSLNNMFFCILSKTMLLYPMFLCYSVFKTHVIEKYVALSFCLKPMFFCLTQKPHPVRRPPLCRRGAGGEAVPRKRENQINTLVLKDINFTINIIDCLITERLIP